MTDGALAYGKKLNHAEWISDGRSLGESRLQDLFLARGFRFEPVIHLHFSDEVG
jgi:hypothetical protein